MGQEDNAKRILTTVLWVLAMILPGGLPMMALWMTGRAAYRRHQQRRTSDVPVQQVWPASKATESQMKVVTAAAATCAGCTAQA